MQQPLSLCRLGISHNRTLPLLRMNPFGFVRLFAEGTKAGISYVCECVSVCVCAVCETANVTLLCFNDGSPAEALQKLVAITTLQMCHPRRGSAVTSDVEWVATGSS